VKNFAPVDEKVSSGNFFISIDAGQHLFRTANHYLNGFLMLASFLIL
jgi:hypothetical protein